MPEARTSARAVPRVTVGWATAIIAYLAVGGCVTLAGLGATDARAMEGIVADGARHMLRTGSYSVPHLHDDVYAYKPPLAYWMAAAAFRLTGREDAWTLWLPFASRPSPWAAPSWRWWGPRSGRATASSAASPR